MVDFKRNKLVSHHLIDMFSTPANISRSSRDEMKLPLRYQLPMVSLLDWWPLKIVLSALLMLFTIEVELVIVLSFLVVLDWITGIWASKRRQVPISSIGLRQTSAKVVEYIIILIVATMLSNAFPLLVWLRPWAFLFICLTEAKSILENIARPGSAADKFWDLLRDQLRQRIGKDADDFFDDTSGEPPDTTNKPST